jgi:hypothetical protein
MSTLATRPLSLWHVDFAGLYARHLCRHSQLGINVAHLAALFGVWFAVYAALYCLVGWPWLSVVLAGAYLGVLVPNVPPRVLAVTAAFLALFVGSLLLLPPLPAWAALAFAALVPVFYKLQAWSHKVWTVERDMTEFNKAYPKGGALFVVLLFYEVPIVLNYLVFDRPWTGAGDLRSADVARSGDRATTEGADVARSGDRATTEGDRATTEGDRATTEARPA